MTSFEVRICQIAKAARRAGWCLMGAYLEPFAVIAQRPDGRRLTILRAGNRFALERCQVTRRPKRGVNALNIEGEAVEFSDYELLDIDGTRSGDAPTVMRFMREYMQHNPAT